MPVPGIEKSFRRTKRPRVCALGLRNTIFVWTDAVRRADRSCGAPSGQCHQTAAEKEETGRLGSCGGRAGGRSFEVNLDDGVTALTARVVIALIIVTIASKDANKVGVDWSAKRIGLSGEAVAITLDRPVPEGLPLVGAFVQVLQDVLVVVVGLQSDGIDLIGCAEIDLEDIAIAAPFESLAAAAGDQYWVPLGRNVPLVISPTLPAVPLLYPALRSGSVAATITGALRAISVSARACGAVTAAAKANTSKLPRARPIVRSPRLIFMCNSPS